MSDRWQLPEIREGWRGSIDKFMGPGPTGLEQRIQYFFSLLLPLTVFVFTLQDDLTIIQYIVLIIIAFDVGGGITTNASPSAKRWYHREGQGARQHLIFISVHIIHFAALLVFGVDWIFALVSYAVLMVIATIVAFTPLYVQRPLSFGVLSILVVSIPYLPLPIYLFWFFPAIFLKLILAHLVKEEPYLPDER